MFAQMLKIQEIEFDETTEQKRLAQPKPAHARGSDCIARLVP
jgi:hypothetical protein